MNGVATTPSVPLSTSSLRLLFTEQRLILDAFFEGLDLDPVLDFCKACLGCTGTILFTGVGKSGFIAQKVCQTFVSTGTKAIFLNPTDALHGDLGIISRGDLVVMFSKSGASDELLRLIPYAKAKGALILAVTSVAESKMAQLSNHSVHLPLLRELCPFDLAPVTSTAVQMLFGDTVAVALMTAKNLTQADLARNHPAGRIGKRLILRVSDSMLTGAAVPTVEPGTLIMDALGELTRKRVGCVLVVGPGRRLLGTFTDGDLRRTLQAQGAQVVSMRVEEAMNASPRVIGSEAMAVDAMTEMERPPRKVTFFPVVGKDQGLEGLITLHDLVSAGL